MDTEHVTELEAELYPDSPTRPRNPFRSRGGATEDGAGGGSERLEGAGAAGRGRCLSFCKEQTRKLGRTNIDKSEVQTGKNVSDADIQ